MASIEDRPRCGKWMKIGKTYCGLPEDHYGRCRKPEAVAASYRHSIEYQRQWVAERREQIDEYKLAKGCERCGYREDAVALDLDHVDPSQKVADVSDLIRRSTWEAVLAELAKTRVLCSNCHRIKTHRETPEAAATASDDGLATR